MAPVNGNPVGWLLLTLTRSIGLPFFVLAATTSILQRWFAETDHRSAEDPYFLYAASNLGSLLALLMYPLIIEPNLRLGTQSVVWAVGYGTIPGTTQLQTLTLNWNGTAWVTVASPNASTGSSVLNSVSTTPGAAIVQAVGGSGVTGSVNPFALQNG